ncbi:MAG: serine--tRNA ligase [Rhodothermia bacterium]
MLDIELLRSDPEAVKEAIRAKGMGSPDLVDQIGAIDSEWRRGSTELQTLKTELNERGRKIGVLMREGSRDEAQALVSENAGLKDRTAGIVSSLRASADRRGRMLLELPNIPHKSVPAGLTPDDNIEVARWGELSTFDFTPRPHWELLDSLNMADFSRGAKVTGAGFPFYIGYGARLQRALIAWFLDFATSEGGYTEIQAPLLVNSASATATGQLPDKEDQMYEVTRDELFVIPTAEVPITNFLRDEILKARDLPIRYCGYTPCFRREAGSYGKDVRGLNRLHQFDKVEIVQFVQPETSYDVLEEMTSHVERLLQLLELPYRRLLMCAGDMGFTQAKKYDLEVWSPGQERWLEVSSISNFEAFQARRAGIRSKDETGGKPRYVHTLNGSALALPRTVAAILETRQTRDGGITVPEVLRDYVGTDRIE